MHVINIHITKSAGRGSYLHNAQTTDHSSDVHQHPLLSQTNQVKFTTSGSQFYHSTTSGLANLPMTLYYTQDHLNCDQVKSGTRGSLVFVKNTAFN